MVSTETAAIIQVLATARSKQIAWKPSRETRKGTGLEQVRAALYEVSESARGKFSTIILTLRSVVPPPGVMWCAHAAGAGGEWIGVTVMYESCSSWEACFQSLADNSYVLWPCVGGCLCPVLLFSKFTTLLAGRWCPVKGPRTPAWVLSALPLEHTSRCCFSATSSDPILFVWIR